jgi:serine/threonine-protein kinase HipA
LQNRYLQATAKACGMESLGKTILEETLESTPAVIAQVASRLYPGFPEAVSVPIFEGLARTTQKLTT